MFVANDGAIKVKAGDSLSKYSMAMYGDFKHIHEFARRLTPGGALQPIKNVNYIQTGWTIYHMPTATVEYVEQDPGSSGPSGGVPMTRQQVRDEVERMLIDDYRFEGGIARYAAETIGDRIYKNRIATGLCSPAIVVAEATGMLGPAAALGLGTLTGVLGAVLGVVGALLALWSNRSYNIKQNGIRGVAYAIVAWSFEDPPPQFPENIRKNLSSHPTMTPVELQQNIDAWNLAVRQTMQKLNAGTPPAGMTMEQVRVRNRVQSRQNRGRLGVPLMQMVADKHFIRNLDKTNFLEAEGVVPYHAPKNTNPKYPDKR